MVLQGIKNWFGVIALVGVFTACNSTKETATDSAAIPGQILVDLKPEVVASSLESKFAKYNLKHSKVVSKSSNIVLYTFDPDKVALSKLIEKVKKADVVEEAQSNKKITNRNR